jgi:hypothetical protein
MEFSYCILMHFWKHFYQPEAAAIQVFLLALHEAITINIVYAAE